MNQSTARLANGQTVCLGDRVSYTNSDGEIVEGVIRRGPDGSLFFWNADHPLTAYKSLKRCEESSNAPDVRL